MKRIMDDHWYEAPKWNSDSFIVGVIVGCFLSVFVMVILS